MSQGATSYRIGVDVGGTNTDAVLMHGRTVVAAVKRPTSADVESGVVDALQSLEKDFGEALTNIQAVMVGTTQFVNSFIQRKNLNEVAAIRVSLPKADGVPPKVAWPKDLTAVIGDHDYMVHGGSYYTGKDYIPLNEEELRQVARDVRSKRIPAAAITSNFAPIRPDIEQRVADILREEYPQCHITKSAEIGGLGLIDRENATIVNASLSQFAAHVVHGLRQAMRRASIDAPLFVSQNDGTLLDTASAERFPVFTCSAGPTNSIRGAAFLTGLSDAVIVDIGGTTTDIGFLKNGFPRETALPTTIGGVRTNFRMPDVLSIGLGGGSIVRETDSGLTVGPDSVGFELLTKGLVFGGKTLTATDIAVASGVEGIGDVARVRDVSGSTVQGALDRIHLLIEDAIDQMKVSNEPVPVVLVGGGSILVSRPIAGAAEVIHPESARVANAVGAAIAQASGRVDRIFDFAKLGREETLEEAKSEATTKAVENGADPDSVEITEVIELPMTHMQTSAVQVKVRAVGDLVL